jgi:complement component 1 Q subcomponent-binding protein
MDLLCENEDFIIDSAQLYSDSKVANEMTAEGDWKRRAAYVGPSQSSSPYSFHFIADTESLQSGFDNLDSALQTEFENFLLERSVNQSLGEHPRRCRL